MTPRKPALPRGWTALRFLPLAALVLLTSAFGLCEDAEDSPLGRAINDVEFRPLFDAGCSPHAKASHGTPVTFTLSWDQPIRYPQIHTIQVGKGKDREVYYGPLGAAERGIKAIPDGSTVTLTTTEDGPARTERVEVWVTLDYDYDYSADFEDLASGDAQIPKGVVCTADIVHSDLIQSQSPSPTPTLAPTPTVVSPPPASGPAGLTLESYPREVRLGETVSFTGEGFTPNCPVTKTFAPPGGTPFSIQATADANGVVTASLEITSDQPTGAWAVTATDDTSGRQAETTFTVVP